MFTKEGNMVFGLGGACAGAQDGKIYFVGAIEEKDKTKVVGKPDADGPTAWDLCRMILNK